jgi:hypothetical protein
MPTNGKTSEDRLRELKEEQRNLVREMAEKDAKNAELAKTIDNKERAVKREASSFHSLMTDVKLRESKTRRVAVDVGGGLSAQALNELWGLGARSLGEWSEETAGKDGFFAKNVDYIQSLPGAIGSILYIIEMALRPEYSNPEKKIPYLPSGNREFFSELTKILGHLGMSNMIRALRFRYGESIDEREIKEQQAAIDAATIAGAKAELEQLKTDLAAKDAQIKQLRAGSKTSQQAGQGSSAQGASGTGGNNPGGTQGV